MGRADDRFFKATMRHFAVLRDRPASTGKGAPPFPKDWFDLPETLWADLGSMCFLSSLTEVNRKRSLTQIMAQLEPPLRLGQYRIFRSGGQPRAFITWAGLDIEAERRFASDHEMIAPEQWNSGTSVWLVDFVAPFGQIDQIIPMLTQNQDIHRLRTLWHNKPGTRRRVVEWRRNGGEIKVTSYGTGQFARKLDEGS